MSSEVIPGKYQRALVFAALALAVGAAIWLVCVSLWSGNKTRELNRADLELRDGALFVRGEATPFRGTMFENHPGGARKLTVQIENGKPHGSSRGWYDSGQMEVDEQFVAGVSHGPRTRWYANGNRRSLAQIDHGKIVGLFTEWHENGQKAVEMTLHDGHPDGVVEAWHPSGAPKSRIKFEKGKQVEKEFWSDSAVAAN